MACLLIMFFSLQSRNRPQLYQQYTQMLEGAGKRNQLWGSALHYRRWSWRHCQVTIEDSSWKWQWKGISLNRKYPRLNPVNNTMVTGKYSWQKFISWICFCVNDFVVIRFANPWIRLHNVILTLLFCYVWLRWILRILSLESCLIWSYFSALISSLSL